MIRNRESASLSRQRRKAHLEGIEKQNVSLENENRQLKHTNVQVNQNPQKLPYINFSSFNSRFSIFNASCFNCAL
jgi:hypothetical protein